MVNISPVLEDEDVLVVAKRRRCCRVNRLIITSESKLYAVVMWNSSDTVAFITDILAHKTTAPQDHISICVKKITLMSHRVLRSYNLADNAVVEMIIKAPN